MRSAAPPPLHAGRLAATLGLAGAAVFVLVAAALVVDPGAGAAAGAPPIGVKDAALAAFGRGDAVTVAVVREARLPRVLLAAAVGAALALAGALLQPLLRNPLADPFVLGVSSGAAFAAVAGMAAGVTLAGAGHPLLSIAGAGLAGLFVHRVARGRDGTLHPERLVLAGVVLSYLLAAGIMWILSLAGPVQGQRYLFWLMGSLHAATFREAGLVLVAAGVGGVLALPVLSSLNLLVISEEHAAASGVAVARTQGLAFLAAAVLTGSAVTVAGSIGFVGLVVPHGVRLVAGPDVRMAAPLSALAGAGFLVLVDLACRLLGEVPVGVVTASLGAPCFLWLLARRGRRP